MINFSILTISDRSSQGIRADLSGPQLEESVALNGWKVISIALCPDEIQNIKDILIEWCNTPEVDIILTTGGTGFSPRDVTPEATKSIIEKEAPGLVEAMRIASLKITPHAMLSRAVAGIRNNKLIINLPGSPKAAKENFENHRPGSKPCRRIIKKCTFF